MRGVVKMFNTDKGYGFLVYATPGGEPEDAFVHISQVDDQQPLRAGESVEFDVSENPRGPAALNVKRV